MVTAARLRLRLLMSTHRALFDHLLAIQGWTPCVVARILREVGYDRGRLGIELTFYMDIALHHRQPLHGNQGARAFLQHLREKKPQRRKGARA